MNLQEINTVSQTMFIWIFQYHRNCLLQSYSPFNTQDYVRRQMNVLLFVRSSNLKEGHIIQERISCKQFIIKKKVIYLMVKYLKLSKNYYNSVSLINSGVIL
jgi:hypothetical protein